MEIAAFLARALGSMADPFLLVPAIAAGIVLRSWPAIAVAVVAIALALEGLVVAMSQGLFPIPFGQALPHRLAAVAMVCAATFAIASWRRRT
jgi:hypothetical protein